MNRKLFTAADTLPSSTRYTPSRVNPVNNRFVGSTVRMYHSVVSSSARSAGDHVLQAKRPRPSSPGCRRGPRRRPNSVAAARGYANALMTPSRIQSTRSTSMPLSNTDTVSDELEVATNGEHRSGAAKGSEYSVTDNCVSRSPTRVPPPGAENAGPPSCAPRPSIIHAM